MDSAPFFSYKRFMLERYGAPLYRIPVDLGFGCPHRGVNGEGGCAFCADDGARARQISRADGLSEQIAAGVKFARQRYGANQFMLYVQAHTGTFADSAAIEGRLLELLAEADFSALSIGTRPDCLPDDTIGMLGNIAKRLEVWVELGVQTTHDSTLTRINRGHDWNVSRSAIRRVAAAGLNVGAHIIVGLPGEGVDEWRETADRLAVLPISGIKIHNLHVIHGTPLAATFAAEPFPVLDEHQYIDALIAILRRLPPDLPIMRLTTDTAPGRLITPRWAMSKGQFIECLVQQMTYRNVRQGDCCVCRSARVADHPRATPDIQDLGYPLSTTDDGSITFWSRDFKEHYHSKVGAYTEAMKKFVEPALMDERLRTANVRTLDICFGLGYNTLAACETAYRIAKGRLEVTAIEIDANVIQEAARHIRTPQGAGLDWRHAIKALSESGRWVTRHCRVELIIGDARARLAQAAREGPFDIAFLDAFSTQRNAELWTVDFFQRMKNILTDDGVLVTYCAALPVRSALMQVGFHVGQTPPIGRKRGGTIAAICREDIDLPISGEERAVIQETTRGIPYRDPRQTWTNRQILRHREGEIRKAKGEIIDGHRPGGPA